MNTPSTQHDRYPSLKPFFAAPQGQSKVAKAIAMNLPKHDVFVEANCTNAAVLFAKQPATHSYVMVDNPLYRAMLQDMREVETERLLREDWIMSVPEGDPAWQQLRDGALEYAARDEPSVYRFARARTLNYYSYGGDMQTRVKRKPTELKRVRKAVPDYKGRLESTLVLPAVPAICQTKGTLDIICDLHKGDKVLVYVHCNSPHDVEEVLGWDVGPLIVTLGLSFQDKLLEQKLLLRKFEHTATITPYRQNGNDSSKRTKTEQVRLYQFPV